MDNSTYLNDEAKSYIEGIRQTKNRMKSRFEDFNDIMKYYYNASNYYLKGEKQWSKNMFRFIESIGHSTTNN